MSDQTIIHDSSGCAFGDVVVQKPRHFDASWQVACSILEYFDSYRVGSVAPIAAAIEKAMDAAYRAGETHG